MSNSLRITGLATGIDTDTLVKQLMQVEQIKIDKVLQEKQLIQWQQELYRDIIGEINSFKSTYFDVLKTDSYMLSTNTYSSFDVVSSAAKYANASASASAVAGTYVLSNVVTATKATQSGNSIKVRQAENQVSFPVDFSRDSITVSITEGEETKEYTVSLNPGEYKSLSDLANHINSQLSKAKLTADDSEVNIASKLKAKVSDDGTKIVFTKSNSDDTVMVDTVELVGDTRLGSDSGFEFDVNIKSGINDTLIVNIDGTNYKVTLNAGSYALDANGLIKEINDALANAKKLNPNGSEAGTEDISDRLKAELSFDGKFIKFSVDSGSGSDVGNINITGNAVKTLGFSSTNFSVSPTASSKMSSIFSGTVKFTVNGKDFEYDFSGADKNKTIQNILDDISSKAGVKASFSELSGRFTISSINTGSNEQLNIGWDNGDSNSAVFLDKLFNIKADNSIEDPAGSNKYYFRTAGTDASVTIKDPNGNVNTVIKSNNTFTIDGVTYSLLQNTTEETKEIELTITSNPDKTFKKIVEFIDRYNSLIDKINSKLTEKKQYSYKPLTDEQKKEMSEKEIELWEEKAKQGLLKGDTYLEGMLSKMRTAFFDPVKNLFSDSLYDSDNIGISLSDIGLSTSSDISQRGKIIIDEAKLKEAIQNHGDKVAELFTKKSTTKPSYSPDMSAADRNARYQESGIFQRINDILQDYVRTTRDSNGKKGLLLEKAGIKGDFSELNNILSEQLKAKERLIEELEKKFAKKQEKYYAQFAQLEKAMNQLNSQSSWLAMQLGTYGG
ncbi:MAG: flagellar filament capping protein FliD [Clostridiales bacterium]|nr:flagellar filament capping protein FliD [Clostridiales bacterium]